MYSITLQLYTIEEIQAAAVPFVVESRLNPAIPRQAGVYVFPGKSKIFYVGKTVGPLYQRVKVYQWE